MRPQKIIFRSKYETAKLLESINDSMQLGATFPQGFRIVRDKTRLQCDLFRSCHSDLNLRSNNGETELCIKYMNSVPKVISDRLKNGVPPQRLHDQKAISQVN